MVTEKQLRQVTKDFFRLFRNGVNGHQPEWSELWNFKGTIPNHDKRGCYALFVNEEIIYIGSGLGKSFGKYHGSGLGDRLKRYWKLNKNGAINREYKPSVDWNELTGIMTIGFDDETFPIAASLEIYLIQKLKPQRNSTHTNRQ